MPCSDEVTLFLVSSPCPLLWVSAETLSRVLKSCRVVLEGAVGEQDRFQAAVRATVGILDFVLYLTCE